NTVRFLSVSTSSYTSSEGSTQKKDGDNNFASSKSSTNARTFFAFQKDGGTQFDPLQPPEKPKDFKSQYLRRPLYGFALKGDSKDEILVIVRFISVICIHPLRVLSRSEHVDCTSCRRYYDHKFTLLRLL